MSVKGKLSTANGLFNPGRIFWLVVAVGVVFMIIGIMLGNPFEDYQAAATL